MCRFVLYHGPEILLADLITRPRNSLIHQSFHAERRREPLNGDGFGVAWFVPDLRPEPARFRAITPAWSNHNLLDLAEVVRSGAILAHVRAATPGQAVVETNCHPFCCDRLAFMHNGYIPDFASVRRKILHRLSEDAFAMIAGTTDTEHIFGLFIDHYWSHGRLDRALRETLADLAEITGPVRTSLLNLAVSDGADAVVSRATLGPGQHESNTLFLHSGMRYQCVGSQCHLVEPCGSETATLVASEPLSDDPGWHEVPPNHLVRLLGTEPILEPI